MGRSICWSCSEIGGSTGIVSWYEVVFRDALENEDYCRESERLWDKADAKESRDEAGRTKRMVVVVMKMMMMIGEERSKRDELW